MAVKPIPDGYHSVTPYLTVKGAAEAIAFYEKVFGARQRLRLDTPNGQVMHAELDIGDSVLMLHDEMPEWKALAPKTIGDSGSAVMLYVPDVDATYQRALDAGATATMPVADQFYGDRCGNFTDPFGHKWCVATHVEDVPPDEMSRRAAKMFEQQGGCS